MSAGSISWRLSRDRKSRLAVIYALLRVSTDVDDGVKREYIPVPIPVPVFIPVPMNMYSQLAPAALSLPVPVRTRRTERPGR